VKATYGSIEVKGGIAEETGEVSKYRRAMLVACPSCGRAASLPIPPFTFDRATLSIGPESVKFPCGWHGYLTNGEWRTSLDSACGVAAERKSEETKMAAKVKVGDRVKALRTHNKAVELVGKVKKIDGNVVALAVESSGGLALDHDTHVENVHIDDVTVLKASKEDQAA
jgi:hypothetical protein